MASAAEEIGNATILGGSINPLQVYMGQQAARQKQQAEQAKLAKEQRDSLHDYMDKYKPEAKFDPLKQRIAGYVTDHRIKSDTLIEMANNNPEKLSLVKRDIIGGQGAINEYIAETDAWKNDYDAAQKIVEDNIKSGLYKPEARSVLRDVLYHDNGSLKSDHDIRAGMNQLQDIVDHPNNYDKNGVAIAFMKSLPEKMNQTYSEIFNPLGQQYNVQDTKTKLGMQQDANGNIVMDPRTGMPKVSMTDDVYIQAMHDPMLSKIVQKEVPNGTVAQNKAYLSALLEGYDPKEVKNRPQLGFKTPADENSKFFKWGINFGHKVDDLEARRDIVQKMASGTRPDVLASIGNVVKGSSAQYVDGGNKIRITYKANLADPNFDPNNLESLKSAYIKNTYNKGKQEVTSDIDISTPEAQNAAEYALSEILDSQNAKTSIGADRFHRYKEAHEKNNPKPEKTKIPGF